MAPMRHLADSAKVKFQIAELSEHSPTRMPGWDDDLRPMPDWDLPGQPEPDVEFDQRISW